MYDNHIQCPSKYKKMVFKYVDGDSKMTREEIESILDEAYENGEMSSSTYDWLINMIE